MDTNYSNVLPDEEDNITPPWMSGKSGFDKATLANITVADCVKKRAVEMRKGYWNEKLDKNGNVAKEWKEDTRKVYINSVIALKLLLAPEIKEDKKLNVSEILEEEQVIYDKYIYEEVKLDYDSLRNLIVKKTGLKYLPDIGSSVLIQTMKGWEMIDGGWDGKANAYIDEVVLVYYKLFEAVNLLTARINYFKRKPRAG